MTSVDDLCPPQVRRHNRPNAFSEFAKTANSIRAGVRVERVTTDRARTPPPPTIAPAKHELSSFSLPAVPNTGWCSSDFALGAGMVIIQPSTHKIVVLHTATDPEGEWFFPKGRKDIGESLAETALREAYEESGYKAEFFPAYNPTRQPPPLSEPEARQRPNFEAIYTTCTFWTEGRKTEYLTFWFLGQITDDAAPEERHMLSNEQDYTPHLFTYAEALERVWGPQKAVLEYAWAVYQYTLSARSAGPEVAAN